MARCVSKRLTFGFLYVVVRRAGDMSFLPDMTILQQLAPDLCALLPSGCDIFLELLCGPVGHPWPFWTA